MVRLVWCSKHDQCGGNWPDGPHPCEPSSMPNRLRSQLVMKITDLKTLVVNAVMRNWVFVKVETDQPGLYGWGEATLEWKTRAVVGCIEDFKPMVVGQDP